MNPTTWTKFKLQHINSKVMRDVINFCEEYGLEKIRIFPATTHEILKNSYLDENSKKLLIKVKCNWFERVFFRKQEKWKRYWYISKYCPLEELLTDFYKDMHKIKDDYIDY